MKLKADWTQTDFFRLSLRYQHKIAAQLLKGLYQENNLNFLNLYRKLESWLGLNYLFVEDFPKFSNRYHYHLQEAHLELKEHHLLEKTIHQVDTPSDVAYLPIHIYLDRLRSAFNVGSILRTTEAFRLGTLGFSPQTPFIDNIKVQKTSMWTHDKVTCLKTSSLEALPKPLIALETLPDAPSVFDFTFPSSFTLILGNEEYGVSQEMLDHCETAVRVPLYGFKNSLNVASCYAIAAALISKQLR